MAVIQLPSAGEWYKDAEGNSFEVITVDEEEGAVEVQFFDGTLEEYDLDHWPEMVLVPREPPEDWTGPFDDLIRDDLGETGEAMHPHLWTGPLDLVE